MVSIGPRRNSDEILEALGERKLPPKQAVKQLFSNPVYRQTD